MVTGRSRSLSLPVPPHPSPSPSPNLDDVDRHAVADDERGEVADVRRVGEVRGRLLQGHLGLGLGLLERLVKVRFRVRVRVRVRVILNAWLG